MSDNEILLKLATKIIYERKRKNLSQEEVASLANINMRSLSLIENGQTNARFLTLYRIANALNIDISELVNFRL
ncbi:TPA: helix-turn-helix transcriptional regulator [Candidatus Scatousia excrementigallinarum]|uniref:Helix-turn-helix transcriptional regulator n=1 Tax=Candidatus Scatousia excrementigallinarum TaxID=2840935 RepID=A0A9D1F150_9BACT|nr:helix-turn-helix transcriptional regulator [Candidatus Scatousia excrementigallinarum]